MADGFGYGGFSGVPYPVLLSSPFPHPKATSTPFLASHPVESYDPTKGGVDPMISNGSYHRSSDDSSKIPSFREISRSQTSSSSLYADSCRPGNFGPTGEYSYKDMYSPSGLYSRESSSNFVPLPTENLSASQYINFVPTYNSATSAPVSSFAEMLTRNSKEPFYKPIGPSGVYNSSNALDDKHPGHYHPAHYHPGYDKPESLNAVPAPLVEPYICVTDSFSSRPMSSLKTQALFDESQTGIHLGGERSFPNNSDVCSHAPVKFIGVQSSLHGSSIEPVNFDVLLGYGEATGDVKPLSEDPDLHYRIVGSPGSRSSRSSYSLPFNMKSSGDSLFKEKREDGDVTSLQNTFVANNEKDISERSRRNEIEDLNYDEPNCWDVYSVYSVRPSAPTVFSVGSESCGAVKANNRNAQSAVNYKTPFEGNVNQFIEEDVQSNKKPRKLQEQLFEKMNRDKTTVLTDLGIKESSRSNVDDVSTGQSPERHLCDQGDFPSPTSSSRVSSVVNAMHNLSEVLVYECFNSGSLLKLEQLENLDKVVDNLTKCLKKITGNKTIAEEASLPTQATHVACPNMVNLNEASKVVTKDLQGFNVKPLDIKEPVDKNEMTQSIKSILASNFPDGEENHPQTLLYKSLWLETEAALCSTACIARYHRIKNEIGNLKLQNKEISADASNFMQEPFLNPQKSVPIMNNVEKETTESLIKHGSNCGNNVVTMSQDAPQSSRFNSDPVDAVLSCMSRSFTSGLEPKIHGNFKPDSTSGKIPDAIHQELPASITEDNHNDVIDWCHILKEQETKHKLKTQNWPETKMDDQEDSPEEANIGSSSHASDVMDRLQILKRREAEQAQKSNLWSESTMTRHENPDEPSDWEHVLKEG